jgi:hypothetical protein
MARSKGFKKWREGEAKVEDVKYRVELGIKTLSLFIYRYTLYSPI